MKTVSRRSLLRRLVGSGIAVAAGGGVLQQDIPDELPDAPIVDDVTLQREFDTAPLNKIDPETGKPYLRLPQRTYVLNRQVALRRDIHVDFNGSMMVPGPGFTDSVLAPEYSQWPLIVLERGSISRYIGDPVRLVPQIRP